MDRMDRVERQELDDEVRRLVRAVASRDDEIGELQCEIEAILGPEFNTVGIAREWGRVPICIRPEVRARLRALIVNTNNDYNGSYSNFIERSVEVAEIAARMEGLTQEKETNA